MTAVCKTDPATLNAVFYVHRFASSNCDVRAMAKWFKSYSVVDVCMESTGKYWGPVYDILEHNGLKLVLTHPKYVKQAKSCKTDSRDAIHIVNLFRMDLIVASFMPISPRMYKAETSVIPTMVIRCLMIAVYFWR